MNLVPKPWTCVCGYEGNLHQDGGVCQWCHAEQAGDMRPYRLNDQPFPKDNGEMASHLKAWTQYRKEIGMDMADSFDFDYYCNDFNDPGQYVQAQLLYNDIPRAPAKPPQWHHQLPGPARL